MKLIIFMKVILILLIICSCNNGTNYKIINQDHYLMTKFAKYEYLFNSINDTLSKWKYDTLLSSQYLNYAFESKLDSMIVFNSDSSRLFTNIIIRDTGHKGAIFDYIEALGGAIINKRWYYFSGVNTTIDRASYQDSIYAPLSFEELSYLAREHLKEAYTINADGSISTNDLFFDFMYNRSGWGLPANSTVDQIDSFIVAKTTAIRKEKIDPKELADIKKEMAASVRPPEPKIETTLCEKIFGREKKLFESKEWKEYLKKKSKS
jgi:hypothetical protein